MKTAADLSRRISELTDDAKGPERTNMQSVLLRAAIDKSSADSWQLISIVLPELRAAILVGELPPTAHALLTNDLPNFYSAAYWDLNEQILLSLAKLYKIFPSEATLHELGVSPTEARLVMHGEEHDRRNPWTGLLDWF